MLTFGSNRCPSKLTWLREHLGLTGPVVVLRAEVTGLSAVWAAGWRRRDGARPATLAVDAGARETHAIWMATPDQVAVLDACEGRPDRYDLARLRVASVRTEDGGLVDAPWTYWPAADERAPLLIDGSPVRCSDVGQARARTLTGYAAALPDGVATPIVGAPDPDSWPSRVFVYGTLQPDGAAWRLLAPHAVGDPEPASVVGEVYDTGWGFPALRLPVHGESDTEEPDTEESDTGDSGGTGPKTTGSNVTGSNATGLDAAGSEAACSGAACSGAAGSGAAGSGATCSGAACAPGYVVTLRDPVAALPVLDEYEGPEYRRLRTLTEIDGGETLPCWVWVWPGSVAGWPRVTGRWRS